MNLGFFIEQERHEAYERAMSRYKAEQAREKRRVSAGQRSTGLGRGARRISKDEAVQMLISRGHRRRAARLLHSLTGGRTVR
jgi:hypothetical protein